MNDTIRIDPTDPAMDLRMVRTPDLWPCGEVLAMRNDNGSLGILVANAKVDRTTVWLLNLFDHRVALLLDGDADGIRSETYETFEAMLEAGWRVN
jgi:hypothetical protein